MYSFISFVGALMAGAGIGAILALAVVGLTVLVS